MSSNGMRPRVHFMDELRGLAVFCMVFYHAFYSLAFVFNVPWGRALLLFFMPAEPFFAGLFIFISGMSSMLSHSNVLRGAKLLGVALAVTAVTVLFLPSESIWFGVLHFLACAMLLFGAMQKSLAAVPMGVGIAACAALYAVTCTVSKGTVLGVPLPAALYATDWLAALGFHSPSFFSADYFPLLPWIFVFLAGTFLGRIAAQGRLPHWMYRSHAPALSFLGKRALLIYVVHQPLIFAAVWLVQWVLGLF